MANLDDVQGTIRRKSFQKRMEVSNFFERIANVSFIIFMVALLTGLVLGGLTAKSVNAFAMFGNPFGLIAFCISLICLGVSLSFWWLTFVILGED